MKCFSCLYPDTKVVYTDKDDIKDLIQRRRECLRCGVRFSTQEKYRDQPSNDEKPIKSSAKR